MFKNLATGTKLFILCGVFIVALAVPISELFIQQKAAIGFARAELAGVHYLSALDKVYLSTLTSQLTSRAEEARRSASEALNALAAAEADAAKALQTAEPEQSLLNTLKAFWSRESTRATVDPFLVDALDLTRDLVSRIRDDSKLAIDPDLESYHLQSILVRELPAVMVQLGEMHTLFRTAAAIGALSSERQARFVILDGLLRSTAAAANDDLAAALRGHAGGTLKAAVEPDIAAMIKAAGLYSSAVEAAFGSGMSNGAVMAPVDDAYGAAVDRALEAWASTRTELARLLQARIDRLAARLHRNLVLMGGLAGLSIFVAVMTHRYIVRPIERMEAVARTVYETKNYGLRVDYQGRDEIGRLAAAFNEMLNELAVAREREIAQQSVLARAERLMAMGEMAASIAHEINQPLAAIVASATAGLRWLGRTTPNLEEAKALLRQIVSDGGRVSQVVTGVRAMFKKDGEERRPIDVNELILAVLARVQRELRSHRVLVRSELAETLPRVLGNPVQLQQVMINLITNAIEAMGSVSNRERMLRVASEVLRPHDLLITVEDSGIGIDAKNLERIFARFFTTKADGMGMGLAICRSIVEAHDGRLWAESRVPHGSVFRVQLPIASSSNGRDRTKAAASMS
jgi:signal transduction histidine kinase